MSDDKLDRAIDRLERLLSIGRKIPELAAQLGVSAVGYQLAGPGGVVAGLVAYRLAKSPGPVSSSIGAGTLAGMGLLSMMPKTDVETVSTDQMIQTQKNMKIVTDFLDFSHGRWGQDIARIVTGGF